jgi:RNA polymerase sigma-B factor
MSAPARNRADNDLFQRSHRGERAAREALVERYLPLAGKLAARYRHGAEPLDDLRQVAAMGLLKSIDRYDPSRGTAFSTFAVPTILGELRRHFRDAGWAIRPPRDLQDLALKLDRTVDDLHGRLGRPPTVAEIADRLDTSSEHVLEARHAAAVHHLQSLEIPVSIRDNRRATLADVIGEDDAGLDAVEADSAAQDLLDRLGHRYREVLRLRFIEDLTQSEIGDRLGISQMQVSRLLREALERLHERAGIDDPHSQGAHRAA